MLITLRGCLEHSLIFENLSLKIFISNNNDDMESSKRRSLFIMLIFILKCFTGVRNHLQRCGVLLEIKRSYHHLRAIEELNHE